jgi:hypothetical protein
VVTFGNYLATQYATLKNKDLQPACLAKILDKKKNDCSQLRPGQKPLNFYPCLAALLYTRGGRCDLRFARRPPLAAVMDVLRSFFQNDYSPYGLMGLEGFQQTEAFGFPHRIFPQKPEGNLTACRPFPRKHRKAVLYG